MAQQKLQQQLQQQQQQLAQQQQRELQQQLSSQNPLQVVQTTGGGMEFYPRVDAGDTGTFGNVATPVRDSGVEIVEGMELPGGSYTIPGQGEL